MFGSSDYTSSLTEAFIQQVDYIYSLLESHACECFQAPLQISKLTPFDTKSTIHFQGDYRHHSPPELHDESEKVVRPNIHDSISHTFNISSDGIEAGDLIGSRRVAPEDVVFRVNAHSTAGEILLSFAVNSARMRKRKSARYHFMFSQKLVSFTL